MKKFGGFSNENVSDKKLGIGLSDQYLSYDDYRRYGIANWVHDYVIQDDHTLYISLYIAVKKGPSDEICIATIPVQNGQEVENVPCFEYLAEYSEENSWDAEGNDIKRTWKATNTTRFLKIKK